MAVRSKSDQRISRHVRVRKTVKGTAERPRLAVFRAIANIHAQLIDDVAGRTLAASSSLEAKDMKANKSEIAKVVGAKLGERAKAAGIETVVFDRGGYRYHGRVKALADAARAAGLRF